MTRAEYLFKYTEIVRRLLARNYNLAGAKRALATLNEQARSAGTLRQMPFKTPKELLEIHGDYLTDRKIYPAPVVNTYEEEYEEEYDSYDSGC